MGEDGDMTPVIESDKPAISWVGILALILFGGILLIFFWLLNLAWRL